MKQNTEVSFVNIHRVLRGRTRQETKKGIHMGKVQAVKSREKAVIIGHQKSLEV